MAVEKKYLGEPGTQQLIGLINGALSDINAQLLIDYDTQLAFDVTEIVFGTDTTSVLGQAVLGRLVLA